MIDEQTASPKDLWELWRVHSLDEMKRLSGTCEALRGMVETLREEINKMRLEAAGRSVEKDMKRLEEAMKENEADIRSLRESRAWLIGACAVVAFLAGWAQRLLKL